MCNFWMWIHLSDIHTYTEDKYKMPLFHPPSRSAINISAISIMDRRPSSLLHTRPPLLPHTLMCQNSFRHFFVGIETSIFQPAGYREVEVSCSNSASMTNTLSDSRPDFSFSTLPIFFILGSVCRFCIPTVPRLFFCLSTPHQLTHLIALFSLWFLLFRLKSSGFPWGEDLHLQIQEKTQQPLIYLWRRLFVFAASSLWHSPLSVCLIGGMSASQKIMFLASLALKQRWRNISSVGGNAFPSNRMLFTTIPTTKKDALGLEAPSSAKARVCACVKAGSERAKGPKRRRSVWSYECVSRKWRCRVASSGFDLSCPVKLQPQPFSQLEQRAG